MDTHTEGRYNPPAPRVRELLGRVSKYEIGNHHHHPSHAPSSHFGHCPSQRAISPPPAVAAGGANLSSGGLAVGHAERQRQWRLPRRGGGEGEGGGLSDAERNIIALAAVNNNNDNNDNARYLHRMAGGGATIFATSLTAVDDKDLDRLVDELIAGPGGADTAVGGGDEDVASGASSNDNNNYDDEDSDDNDDFHLPAMGKTATNARMAMQMGRHPEAMLTTEQESLTGTGSAPSRNRTRSTEELR
jgi:hypothetical protein